MAKMKPRITKAVRDGWGEIYALITCELENREISQFECKGGKKTLIEEGDVAGTYDIEAADAETCTCEGCVAWRNAHAAIDWINTRL